MDILGHYGSPSPIRDIKMDVTVLYTHFIDPRSTNATLFTQKFVASVIFVHAEICLLPRYMQRLLFMNFFEVASKIEEQGYHHYLKLADEIHPTELAQIMLALAKEEKKHQAVFDALKSNQSPDKPENAASDAAKLFRRFTDTFSLPGSSIFTVTEAFNAALGLEQQSISAYEDALKEARKPAEKNALTSILAEEKKHLWLLNSLKTFLRNPAEWPQETEWYQAEFN